MNKINFNENLAAATDYLKSRQQHMMEYVSDFIKNIKSVTPSDESIISSLHFNYFINMVSSGLSMLNQLGVSDRPITEELPDYIASGRAIRQASESIANTCHTVITPPLLDGYTCKNLHELALGIQASASRAMDLTLPHEMDQAVRSKVISNIYSEQFN